MKDYTNDLNIEIESDRIDCPDTIDYIYFFRIRDFSPRQIIFNVVVEKESRVTGNCYEFWFN